ncbi:MAG: hypothetical protein ACRDNS_33205, partial [Trebonia sp.]
TYRLISKTLAKDKPDGSPSEALSAVLDALLEASIVVLGEPSSSSCAVDWTAHETWSRPPPKHAQPEPQTEPPAADSQQPATRDPDPEPAGTQPKPQQRQHRDREAAWWHRTVTHPTGNEMFYGYYLQALTTVRDEHRPQVPELARRIHLASCQHDPPAQIVPVIQRMHDTGIAIGDLMADSGYSYRQPEHWALPIRALGAKLIVDLHPNDRGTHGTHQGATAANGNLYCPATPKPLLELSPLQRGASPEQTENHDHQCTELTRYKLAPITAYDQDGYRRVICPAAQGKLRCPLRPECSASEFVSEIGGFFTPCRCVCNDALRQSGGCEEEHVPGTGCPARRPAAQAVVVGRGEVADLVAVVDRRADAAPSGRALERRSDDDHADPPRRAGGCAWGVGAVQAGPARR